VKIGGGEPFLRLRTFPFASQVSSEAEQTPVLRGQIRQRTGFRTPHVRGPSATVLPFSSHFLFILLLLSSRWKSPNAESDCAQRLTLDRRSFHQCTGRLTDLVRVCLGRVMVVCYGRAMVGSWSLQVSATGSLQVSATGSLQVLATARNTSSVGHSQVCLQLGILFSLIREIHMFLRVHS
jgi:hypothetical protein